MSFKRDGFGCLPLLGMSLLGIAATLRVGPYVLSEGAMILTLVALVLLPLAYLWTPADRRSSVVIGSFSAAGLPRRVRDQIGDGRWTSAPGFKKRRTTTVEVGGHDLPLEVRRLRFRKHPDLRVRLKLPAGFPWDLAFKSSGLLGARGRGTRDPGFDGTVATRGDHLRLMALLDDVLREDVARWVGDHVLKLSEGELSFEVHGLDVREKGMKQVRAFLRLASRIIRASEAPLGDRLHDRARTDPVATVRAAAARALWSLEPDSQRATTLRADWQQPDQPPLHRITACEDQEVPVAFSVLSRLLTDPNTPTAFVALAARRLGSLDHPDVVPTLRGLAASDPEVQKAVAEALARLGHEGGGLSLATGDGGQLAMAGAQEGDLALAGTQEGALALEPPPRPPKQKA